MGLLPKFVLMYNKLYNGAPTKKQIMDLKAKKKVSAAMKISVIMERQIPISKFSGS